jgi:hypothetical protein
MKWYNAVRDFLYVHSWLQGLIFGSLVAVIGGGSFLHRRKERQHARDLVEVTRRLGEANQEANQFRGEANRLSAELLKAHKEFAATMQPEKEKIRPRLLQQKGKTVMFLRESYRGSYEPSIQILVDVNEDSIILRGSGTGNQPTASWPLVKVTTETDAEGRFMVVFDDSAKPRR